MNDGARFNLTCHASPAIAAAHECAQVAGATSAGYVRCVGVTTGPTGPVLQVVTSSSGGVTSSMQVTPVYQLCDPFEPYQDIVHLFGFAVPAVLAVVLVREFVTRHLMPQ